MFQRKRMGQPQVDIHDTKVECAARPLPTQPPRSSRRPVGDSKGDNTAAMLEDERIAKERIRQFKVSCM